MSFKTFTIQSQNHGKNLYVGVVGPLRERDASSSVFTMRQDTLWTPSVKKHEIWTDGSIPSDLSDVNEPMTDLDWTLGLSKDQIDMMIPNQEWVCSPYCGCTIEGPEVLKLLDLGFDVDTP